MNVILNITLKKLFVDSPIVVQELNFSRGNSNNGAVSFNHLHQAIDVVGLSEFISKEPIEWLSVVNSPSEFTPKEHNHQITDIDNLDSQLSAINTQNQLLSEQLAASVLSLLSHNTDSEAHHDIRTTVAAVAEDVVDFQENLNAVSAVVSSNRATLINQGERLDQIEEANLIVGNITQFTASVTNSILHQFAKSNNGGVVRRNLQVIDGDSAIWNCSYVNQESDISTWEVIGKDDYVEHANSATLATSATKLQTPRMIGSASFDGTANITLTQIGVTAAIQCHNTDSEAHHDIRSDIESVEGDLSDLTDIVDTQGGLIAGLDSYYDDLNNRVSALNGAAILIGSIDLFTSQITDVALTARAVVLKGDALVGYTLVDSDNVEWWCEQSNGSLNDPPSGSWVASWNNIGQNVIGTATNSTQGVVKGSTEIDKVSISNGVLTVNNISGSKISGSVASATLATSATKLQTPRMIGSASFDGTANITIQQMGVAAYEDIGELVGQHNTSSTAHSDIRALAAGAGSRLDAVEDELDEKAQTNHASSAMTYGVGNGTYYGHLKLTDTPSTQNSSSGTAATPALVGSAIEDIEIGGVNLFTNSSETDKPFNIPSYNYISINPNGVNYVTLAEYGLKVGDTFTASAILTQNQDGVAVDTRLTVAFYNGSEVIRFGYGADASFGGISKVTDTIPVGTVSMWIFASSQTGGTIGNIRMQKLERGNKTTAWSPSLTDTKTVGSWTIEESTSGQLLFKKSGVTVARLDSTYGIISEKDVQINLD